MNSNNFEITPMNKIHLKQIEDVLESDFDDFWDYSIFESELENPNSKYFVVVQDDEIVGFAGVLIVLDTADITNIVIKKSYRGMRYFKITTRAYCKLLQKC